MNIELENFNYSSKTHIVLFSGGFVSSYIVRKLYDEAPDDNIVILVTNKRKAIAALNNLIVECGNNVERFKYIIIPDDQYPFEDVELWLRRCLFTYFDSLSKCIIYIGYTKENYKLHNFQDWKVNSIVHYPYKNIRYHDMLFKTIIPNYPAMVLNSAVGCDKAPELDEMVLMMMEQNNVTKYNEITNAYCGECESCKSILRNMELFFSYSDNSNLCKFCFDFCRAKFNKEIEFKFYATLPDGTYSLLEEGMTLYGEKRHKKIDPRKHGNRRRKNKQSEEVNNNG